MTVELNERDIKALVNLVTTEIDRVGEAKEKHGFGDLGYFYHLEIYAISYCVRL